MATPNVKINPDTATRQELETFLGADAVVSVLRSAVKTRIKEKATRDAMQALKSNPTLKAQLDALIAKAKG